MENNRKSKANESLGILMRVIKYMVTNYKLAFLAVLACIILSAAATARGMLFIQSLVDDYIQPLLALSLIHILLRKYYNNLFRDCQVWPMKAEDCHH